MLMLERIDATKRLWTIAIPQCPAPLDTQLLWWLETFTDDEVEHAVRRTAKKFRITEASHETFYRYASGVMLNERKGVTPGSHAGDRSAPEEV